MIIYYTKQDLEDIGKGKKVLPVKIIKEDGNDKEADKMKLALALAKEKIKGINKN